MTLLQVIASALRRVERYDPHTDDTVQYLRGERRAALLETRRLQRVTSDYFPLVDYVRRERPPR